MSDPSLVHPLDCVGILNSLSYQEVPMEIFDFQVHRLQMKDMSSVKVLWRNQKYEEATMEAKEDMKSKNTFLFPILENYA